MKSNLKMFIFLFMFICLCQLVSSNGVSPLENNPMYKIIMSQVEIMSKESTEKNGFAKIQALLDELIDSTHSQLQFTLKQKNLEVSRCNIQEHSLSLEIEQFKTLKALYIKRLANVRKNNKLRGLLRRLRFRLYRLRKQKLVYLKTFQLVKEKYDTLVKLSKEIYPHIQCAQSNFEELLSNSLKSYQKISHNKKLLLRLIRSEATICYNDFKNILKRKIVHMDDTANCQFKSVLLDSLARSNPKSENYIAGVHNTGVILKTLKSMNKYFKQKFWRYSNSEKLIFSFNTGISSIEKLINNLEKHHLKNYILVKKGLRAQINQVTQTIEILQETLVESKNECKQNFVSLTKRQENLETSIESYKELRLFFNTNYSRIAKSMEKKYHH